MAEVRDELAVADEPGATPSTRLRPQPGTLTRFPPFLNCALFALTFASVFLTQALTDDGTNLRAVLFRSLGFAVALIAILLSHEMGHFLLARRHRVDASWPFFIPAPLLSMVGTLGAVIRLRQLPRSRKALVDIGAAGPLAGFVVTTAVLAIGLHLSQVVPDLPEPARYTLFDGLQAFLRTGHFPALRDSIDLGEPLAMLLLERVFFGALPKGSTLALHPVAVAGWFGLFLTAINLLPIGQLDGGHLLFAASPRLHRRLGAPFAALLVGLGVFTPFAGWALWGIAIGLFFLHHPPLDAPEPRLGTGRTVIIAVSVAVFALSFHPVPVALFLR